MAAMGLHHPTRLLSSAGLLKPCVAAGLPWDYARRGAYCIDGRSNKLTERLSPGKIARQASRCHTPHQTYTTITVEYEIAENDEVA